MSACNAAATLRRAVDSVLSQDGADFEFVIVNDGSKDDTGAMLDDYARRDPRVRVFHQENAGLTRSLMRGCAEARGRFIARQDADDVSLPGRLVKQTQMLDADPDMVLAVAWTRIVGPGGETLEEVTSPTNSAELTRLLREEMRGIPSHGCAMFRRDAYLRAGGYRPQFYYAQDCDLWLRLAPLGAAGCVGECLYELHQSVGSISSARRELQARFGALAQAAYQARRRGESEEPFLLDAEQTRQTALNARGKPPSRRNRATACRLMASALDHKGGLGASKYHWMAVYAWPLDLRAWRGLAAHYLFRRGRRP